MAGPLANIPICMLGGDTREVKLAEALIELEVDLRLVGFPLEGNLRKAAHFTIPAEAAQNCRAVIAPMSNTDLAGNITSRPDQNPEPIFLPDVLAVLTPRTPLLIGVAKPVIRQLVARYGLRLVETASVDEIAVLNSIPTAEGAIQVAMEETPITIHGSKCLVVGLGRCGTAIVQRLLALGACVTAAARSPGDLARAVVMGAQPLELRRISTQVEFDIIFNTVPALVLDRSYLRHLSPETVIIDIASSPGGTDFEAAQQQGIKAIHALSLPGKVAPVTAGQILVQSIPRLLENLVGEENHDT
ncbi:MAG: dipicolinate synthase subunit DpsA [Firmicutes bacterium]|nr:dipicolinate synthase subunit DpsA [Bacillota bacterium]